MNTNQAILSGIIKGDEQILKKFYRDNVKYIGGFILRNSGNEEDVEDIFQDAMVVLYQKLKSDFLEINVPIRTYFFGICKNLWLTRLRKKNKIVTNEVVFENQKEISESNQQLSEKDEREHLYNKHFCQLSVGNKKMLSLYFEGKSVREISTITGFSEGYTRKKKFEAKKQLLRMIEKDPAYRELVAC